MSDTLDWMFELDGDTSGADRLLKTLDRMDKTLTGLDGKLDGVDKATRHAGEGHKEHATQATGLAGSLKALEHQFGSIVEVVGEWKLAEKLYEIPGALMDIGEEMLKVAARAERTSKAFDLVFGAGEGKENLEYIEKIGKYTEFSQEQIKQSMLGLGKVGFKGAGLDRALAAAHDMAAFSANPEEGLSSALSTLERVKRTGRVDNRALGGLGIGEHDFFGELAKRTGKSAAALKKEMDKGTLNTEDALETLYTMITKRTGKDLGGAAVDMSKSMTSVLTHLQELPERYFERLKDSPAFATFRDQLSHVLDALDPNSENGRQIFTALEDAFDGLGKILGAIDWAAFIETATHALETFEEMFLKALSFIPGETSSNAGFALNEMKKKRHERDVDTEDRKTFVKSAKEHGTTPGFEAAAAEAADYNDLDEAEASGALGTKPAEKAGEDMSAAAEKGFRKQSRTHSPSDAWRDIGLDLAAGLEIGMSEGMDRVAPPEPIATSAAARGRGGGPVHIEVTIPVAIGSHGGTAAEHAEEFRMHLRSMLPGELSSAFEQLGMESGG